MKKHILLLITGILTICMLPGCAETTVNAKTPSVTVTKTSINTSKNKLTTPISKPTTTNPTTPKPKSTTTKPATTPVKTPVVVKKSGIADINKAWRLRYFRLDANSYTGDKIPIFDAITLNVASGKISKTKAETQIKNLGTWTESKTNQDCFVFDARITVYTTSSNDVQTIVGEVNDRRLFRGDTYSNSYIYYDASIKKNRVVMIGIALPSTF